ncbi:NUDIX hydrolase [Cellulomonas denverensis]|uniref:CoA pyrophosphatase n=1 Tax=Cellulomonas denverensis TaxID=264297 RepID=A0A7X6KWV6_9CELL|nr:CoA pyrophosphatase [Cellulomonas denverensis]NKY23330.1 CoA pyrophosphatase [Cellulomonas denverensis]
MTAPGPIWNAGAGHSGTPSAAALDDLLALCTRRPVWSPDPLAAFATGTPVRRSAVLVLFGVLDSHPAQADAPAVATDLDVLLTRRSPTLSHHPGQVAFPGGGIDPEDAGPEAAALRESAEEAGVDPTGVRVLGTLPDLPVTASSNLVTPVLGWWDRPHRVAAADPAETVDVFRAPVADLVDPAHRVTAVLEHRGHEYRGPAFEVERGILVWGFTAFVLDRLLDATGWAVPWDTGRTVPAPV